MKTQVPRTVEEVWAILEDAAALQKETDRILRETALSMKDADRRIQETDRIVQETTLSMKETDRKMQETDRKMQETDRKMQETDRRMQDTDRRLKALVTELNGISKSNGDFAEAYFNNAFEQDNLLFADMHFDYMKKDLNLSNPKSGKRDEQYDIVLYNDKSIVIIEIKYKACKNDINDLIRKAEAFRGWFPEYSDYKIYLGLAGMSFLKNTLKNADDKGIAIIRQKGDKTVVNDKNLKAY
jgi:hypothetical protein